MTLDRYAGLGAVDQAAGTVNAVIETPKGSRNKYTYDDTTGIFRLKAFLPIGAVFPFDFGFLPGTLGGDGDPLDILLLMDEPAFPGCLVASRLVGVIEADQTESEGVITRNDRLIGVAAASLLHSDVRSLSDLNGSLLQEIEHFFISYNVIKGRNFRPLGRSGSERARLLVEEGIQQAARR